MNSRLSTQAHWRNLLQTSFLFWYACMCYLFWNSWLSRIKQLELKHLFCCCYMVNYWVHCLGMKWGKHFETIWTWCIAKMFILTVILTAAHKTRGLLLDNCECFELRISINQHCLSSSVFNLSSGMKPNFQCISAETRSSIVADMVSCQSMTCLVC